MNIIIPDDTELQRLDHFLTKEFSSHSRTYWQKKIQRNLVAVDGKHVSKHFEVTPGMRIDIAENEEQTTNINISEKNTQVNFSNISKKIYNHFILFLYFFYNVCLI